MPRSGQDTLHRLQPEERLHVRPGGIQPHLDANTVRLDGNTGDALQGRPVVRDVREGRAGARFLAQCVFR